MTLPEGALDWIEQHAAGARPAPEPRVRPWGFVTRVDTPAREALYFKASPRALRHEAAVTATLARLCPERLPEVVGVDAARGWLLLRDGGPTLRDALEPHPDASLWEHALREYALLQIAAVPAAEELVGHGCPDLRGVNLRERSAALVADPALGATDGGLERGERAAILARIDALDARIAALEACGVPDTIQHDDLHDGNVFAAPGRCRFFDWGDASVAHPFYSLTVPLRAAGKRFGWHRDDPGIARLRDAYLEPWSAFDAGVLDRALALAAPLAMLSRAHTWHALSLWVDDAAAASCRTSGIRWLREAADALSPS